MLSVKIEGDEIVIRLPQKALRFATQHNPLTESYDQEAGDYTNAKVTDIGEWGKAVVQELNAEEEDGTTLVHQMFDKAFSNAIDGGAEGVEMKHPTDKP